MTEFSEEEGKKILDAFKALGAKPDADSAEDLQTWMLGHLQAKGKVPTVKPEEKEKNAEHAADVVGARPVHSQWPRLSTFSGDDSSKTDVSFDLWKYEVSCLLEDKLHPEEAIRQAIRRSLRGQAARAARNVGLKADSRAILEKLEAVFGTVEVGQTLLSEFYAARQKKGEDVASWGCRLEDMVNRMQDQGLIPDREANDMLRTQFWTNLNQRLKDSSRHKFDSVQDFDRLRREIRVIEREYKMAEGKDEEDAAKSKKLTSQRATASTNEAPPTEEKDGGVKELRGMVHKLSSQMESMQQQLKSLGQGQQPVYQPYSQQPPHPQQQQMTGSRQHGPVPGQQTFGPGPGQPPTRSQVNPQQTSPQDARQGAVNGGQFYSSQHEVSRGMGQATGQILGQGSGQVGGQSAGYGGTTDQRYVPQEQYSQGQSMVGNGCFKCGIVGHYKWNCPLKNERIVCYLCHQPGHAKRDCPYQHLNSGWPLSRGGQ